MGKDELVDVLKNLLSDVISEKILIVDVRSWRPATEKPIHETGPFYKEFEPSAEYHVDFTLIKKEG